MVKQWMLYGANGYTGTLTAREAKRRGLSPMLAGRNPQALRELAKELDLPYLVFDLSDPDTLHKCLEGIDAVVHMAGPFIHTSEPMVNACLETGTHYMDITGEWPVFESIFARNEQAQKAGVVLLPGVGFDVVPSDCLAATLKQDLPDAVELELAIGGFGSSKNSISRGTLKTMVEGIGMGSMVRVDGKLQPVSALWRTPEIDFPNGKKSCVTMPWGDISSAFFSTGIPNIAVYFVGSKKTMKFLDLLRPVLKTRWARSVLQAIIQATVYGPDRAQRERSGAYFWGRVKNAQGKTIVRRLKTPEGYSLTADSSIASVLQILKDKTEPGAHTPATAFSPNFIDALKGFELGPVQTE